MSQGIGNCRSNDDGCHSLALSSLPSSSRDAPRPRWPAPTASHPVTKSDTEMKGSIRDPTLVSLEEFAKVNDIHAVGHILAFMFTGRSSIAGCPPAIQLIVDKSVHNDPTQRYQDISEVIADLELATE
jgi:hypothetical protein